MIPIEESVTIRTINGLAYRCRDVGCADFEAARKSRDKVANKCNINAYLVVERTVLYTPLKHKLPAWVPMGDLPYVSKGDWGTHSRDSGMTELEQEFEEVEMKT